MTDEAVLSPHTVSYSMHLAVLKALSELELPHDVAVLFACESGSRGYGFASPHSRYEVRFIYISRLPRDLTIKTGLDVIKQIIGDKLDISGWDLRKALELLKQSCHGLSGVALFTDCVQAGGRLRNFASGAGQGRLFSGGRLPPLSVDSRGDAERGSVRRGGSHERLLPRVAVTIGRAMDTRGTRRAPDAVR